MHWMNRAGSWRGGAAALVVLTLGVLYGCASETSAPPNDGVTVRELTANPTAYSGMQVTLSARVFHVTTPEIFSIGPQGDVLVLRGVGSPPPPNTDVGDVVRVRGVNRVFSGDVIEREFGGDWATVGPMLGTGFYSLWNLRPMVVASSIEVLPPEE